MAARALLTKLRVSRPALSRLVSAAGEAVLRAGKARYTRYAATGDVRGERSWPLYRIDGDARVIPMGEILALHGDHFFVALGKPNEVLQHRPFEDGIFPALPWYLDDQRPQGFQGRNLAHRIAGPSKLPSDIKFWSPKDAMVALLSEGHDQLGDLVIGEVALRRALDSIGAPQAVEPAGRGHAYLERAEAALRGEPVGSSAAGEQPKFTAILREGKCFRSVIVKFSDSISQAAGARWAQMLRMEQHAAAVLAQAGIPAARAEIIEAGGRVFLESTRFDRTSCLGRRGFVSLAPLAHAMYGHADITWRDFAVELERDGWIDQETASRMQIISWFGNQIGNTDMHLGNLALSLGDTLPLSLAPVYDMLPMVMRPGSNGAVIHRDVEFAMPRPGQFEQWRLAAPLALSFWEHVLGDEAIDDQVRVIATNAHDTLTTLVARIG